MNNSQVTSSIPNNPLTSGRHRIPRTPISKSIAPVQPVQPFRISGVPVTNAAYKLFVDTCQYKAPANWENGQIPAGYEQHPVVYVSWHDAQSFCRWAGVRLPTVQEWQLAAGGPYKTRYPWGNHGPHNEIANFGSHVGITTPVGSYPAGKSHYGLLDMAGNVWEWTDTVDESASHRSGDSPTHHTARRRMLCGGSFDDVPVHLECRATNTALSTTAAKMIGFRVVIDLPDKVPQQDTTPTHGMNGHFEEFTNGSDMKQRGA